MQHVLLLTAGTYHDFQTNGLLLRASLESCSRFQVTHTQDAKTLLGPKCFDAVVLYAQGEVLSSRSQKALADFVRNGGALVALHLASVLGKDRPILRELIGGRFVSHSPIHEFEVVFDDPTHDITRRVPNFSISDELYHTEVDRDVQVFMSTFWKGRSEPMGYTKSYGKGMVVYLALGHDERALNHPTFRKLVTRSVDYALGKRETGEVRCGIIGYGGAFNMGKHHGDSINNTIGMRVVAVCDVDKTRTEQAAQDFLGITTYSRVADIVRDPNVDLCVVITPHNSHARIALQCINAGKSVVVEKPFCISVKEADQMIEAARRNKVVLTVFHNRRYDGDFMTLKEILASGVIGEVFKVEACFGGYGKPGTWWRSDKKISGGAFYDWGAHFVDWVLNLVPQPIESVSGFFFNKMHWQHVTNEDHCEAIIKFRNGAVATLQMSSLGAIPGPRWRILGTEGGIVQDDAVPNTFTVVSHKTGQRVQMHIPFRESLWHRYYPALADHIFRDEELVVKPKEARRVIGVIEYAERSAKSGKPEKIPGE